MESIHINHNGGDVMADREKVMTWLEICGENRDCSGTCPYSENGFGESGQCKETLMTDALTLLKEQEWHMLKEDEDGIIHGLPGDDGQYIMTDGKCIWIDDYVDGVDDGVWLDSGRDIREIRAWMYMPKLPILD